MLQKWKIRQKGQIFTKMNTCVFERQYNLMARILVILRIKTTKNLVKADCKLQTQRKCRTLASDRHIKNDVEINKLRSINIPSTVGKWCKNTTSEPTYKKEVTQPSVWLNISTLCAQKFTIKQKWVLTGSRQKCA